MGTVLFHTQGISDRGVLPAVGWASCSHVSMGGNLDSIERAHHSGLHQSHSPVSNFCSTGPPSGSHDCTSHITRTRGKGGMGYLHDDEPQAPASLAPLYIFMFSVLLLFM